MTQVQLDRAVARATGETLREIRARGFSLLLGHRGGRDRNDPQTRLLRRSCAAALALVPPQVIPAVTRVGRSYRLSDNFRL
jgi:hypothetical protein